MQPAPMSGIVAALRWLASGAITAKHLRSALSDHEGAPDSICRHPEDGAQSKTIFWCIADVTEGKLMYGRGNPCNSTEQTLCVCLTARSATRS